MLGVLAILWFEAICVVLLWLFFIWSCPGDPTILFSSFISRISRNGDRGECWQQRGWLSEKARKWKDTQGALLPVLLVNMPSVSQNGRERQICSCSFCIPTSCSKHIKGGETREKGEQLLSAVGLSQEHPSVQLQLATSETQSGRAAPGQQGQSPQVMAQPTHRLP